ncbi:hypothetical protein C3Y87_13740 [Carbonactinospora thermoautotrophica]|uniref:hypothetical protein n=1 Tax=Carbonactinospora thermoautotrophica TaxID=1469144 RepID=UPI00226EA648|nr:hypothetical protein [Carbonactinospora thermoautotrophica]MCX9192455.1 hypothetical protein [Carbonactinospora thermoautotrophica]
MDVLKNHISALQRLLAVIGLLALLTGIGFIQGGPASAAAKSDCFNKGGGKVKCLVDVSTDSAEGGIDIEVKNIRALSGDEIRSLEDSLNRAFADIDLLSADLEDIRSEVKRIFENSLGEPVGRQQIKVCLEGQSEGTAVARCLQ